MGEVLLRGSFYWSFIACFGCLTLFYLMIILYSIVAAYENLARRSDAHADDYEPLLYSRFTIPVSVIAPAYNEEVGIVAVVRCLLNLEYAEYEVIVVDDGSTDNTFQHLQQEFALEPVRIYYRKTLKTAVVRGIHRSTIDPRLLVITKNNGGKADALNCGVNFARYRYVCCVDGGDTLYKRNALLVAMRMVMKDPATTLGLTSLIGVSRHLDVDDDVECGQKAVDRHVWSNLQHLDMLRAFVNNRLAWSRMGFMLCVSGAFAIWRRDVVQEVGGFSRDFTCEDIEITFRVTEKYRREKRPAKILSLPNIVAVTEGPETVSALISQRARWQRVILETVWHYRRVLLNPRYGLVGFLGVPYIILSECLSPVLQILVLITLVLGAMLGEIGWRAFLFLFGIQVFATSIISTLAVWMNDWSFRYYRFRDIVRLILIAPLDLLFYRPILAYANVKGFIQYLRGDKTWHRFARNKPRLAA